MGDNKKRRHREPSDSGALQDDNSSPAGKKEGKKRKTGALAVPETTGTDNTKRPSETHKLLRGIKDAIQELSTTMTRMETKINTIHDEVTKMTHLPAHVMEHMNSMSLH